MARLTWAGLSCHLLCWLALVAGNVAYAGNNEPLARKDVPDPLKTWVPWVLHEVDNYGCSHLYSDAKQALCAWPGVLQLQVKAGGGKFSQSWQVQRTTWVNLPGSSKQWPQQVMLDGKAATVLPHEDGPALQLEPGEHRIEGVFIWDKMPESLALPATSALLQLEINGQSVALPNRDENNQLWLQTQNQNQQQDDETEFHLYRLISEGVPGLVSTRITLDVAGKARELSIGRALLPNLIAQELQTPLTAKLSPDGSLLVQAKPGHWEITLVARHPGQLDQLSLPPSVATDNANPANPAQLLAGEEIWAYQAAPTIRQVNIEGVASVDSSQTTLPAEWRSLPAYLMRPGSEFKLKTLRRGDAHPDPDKLKLERQLWLSLDGGSITASDHIKGKVNQADRIEMGRGGELGRVSVNQNNQLISIGASGLAGIELKRGNIDLDADSLLPAAPRRFTVTGWKHDMEQVSLKLALPPGWRLLHASGPDQVHGSWLSQWNLFSVFLVLLGSFSVYKLYGWRWGGLAFMALWLGYHEMGALLAALLALLACSALLRVVTQTKVQKVLQAILLMISLVSIVVLLEFASGQALFALNPVLDPDHTFQTDNTSTLSKSGAGRLLEEAKPEAPAASAAMDAPMEASAPAAAAESAQAPAESKAKLAQKIDDTAAVRKGMVREMEKMVTAKDQRQYYSGSRSKQYAQIDPGAKVQTGPGLPSWQYQTINLNWRGVVQADQELNLWLLPPWCNRLVALLRIALIGALLLRVIAAPLKACARALQGAGQPVAIPPVAIPPVAMPPAAILICCLLLAGTLPGAPAQAQLPDSEMLETLKNKLSVEAACLPNCADIADMTIQIEGQQLRLTLTVNAAIDSAIPMPGAAKQWLPQQALLDQKPAYLHRTDDGSTWLLVPKGQHRVQLQGNLPQADSLQLPLPAKPRRVSLVRDKLNDKLSDNWDLQGWSESTGAADTLQLTRKVRSEKTDAAPQLPPLLKVERRLSFDLVWRVETQVTRASPVGTPILASIPLLPGEAVTSADIIVKEGQVMVNFGPQTGQMHWSSTLSQQPGITLKAAAAANTNWHEVWIINASGRWHLASKGLAPVQAEGEGDGETRYLPFPGESLQLTLSQPKALSGQTITVDKVRLLAHPAERTSEYELDLTLRTSQGGNHTITLPDGAKLQSTQINGLVQSLQLNGRDLILPLSPGLQKIQLRWRLGNGLQTLYQTQGLDLHLPALNYTLQLAIPQERWLLWVQGPGVGPSLLFWGKLLIALLVAVLISRNTGKHHLTPLSLTDWLLLSLGLSQTPWPLCVIIVGWLFLPGRQTHLQGWRKTLAALGAGFWTLIMLASLCYVLTLGLLSHPDMSIVGNASNSQLLNWYLDRSGATLPGASAFSLPLSIFRACMLLWALWLAWSLLKWLKWAWQELSKSGGLWHRPGPQAIIEEQVQ